ENVNANTTDETEVSGRGTDTQHELVATVPASFKIGFAGSTGAATQEQIIKLVKVTLPFFPETGADQASICADYTTSVTLNPFENDAVYRGAITGNPTSGNTADYIDFDTFRFEDSEGNPIGTATAYTVAEVGTWEFDRSNGQVV